MIIKFPFRSLLRIELKKYIDLIAVLIFFYFFSLHADRLGLTIGGLHFRLNNVLSFLMFGFFIFKFKKNFSLNRNLFLSLLALVASILISFFMNPYKKRTFYFVLMSLFTFGCYVAVPYFLIKCFNKQKILRLYFYSFLSVGFYCLLQLVLSFFGFKDPFVTQKITDTVMRPNAMAYEPSFYALYMTPFVAIINFLFLMDKKREWDPLKKIDLKTVVLVNVFFLISFSTSSYFSYFLFVLILLLTFRFFKLKEQDHLILKQAYKFLVILILGSLLLLLVFPNLTQMFFMKFFFTGTSNCSFFQRWFGIVNCWEVFLEKPFFGTGIGGVGHYLYDQWLSGNPQILVDNDIRLLNPEIAFKAFEPMNVFTEILASLGIFGLIAFLVPVYFYIRMARAVFENALIPDKERKLVAAFLISTLLMIIVLQINQGLFRTYVWVHFSLTFSYMSSLLSEARSKENLQHFSEID